SVVKLGKDPCGFAMQLVKLGVIRFAERRAQFCPVFKILRRRDTDGIFPSVFRPLRIGHYVGTVGPDHDARILNAPRGLVRFLIIILRIKDRRAFNGEKEAIFAGRKSQSRNMASDFVFSRGVLIAKYDGYVTIGRSGCSRAERMSSVPERLLLRKWVGEVIERVGLDHRCFRGTHKWSNHPYLR